MGKLPKPRFNLRSPNARNETLIFLIFRYRGNRFLYSTGLNINPRDWDKSDQRPVFQNKRQDLFMIKRELDNLASYCLDIYIESDYGAINPEEFKTRLDQKIGKKVFENPLKIIDQDKVTKPTFFEFIEQELLEMKAANMKRGSFKIFKRHAAILREFALEKFPKGRLFDYNDVDWNFRLKLIDWLAERNFQLAYGNKTLKILRQFLEKAKRKKLHNNSDYHGTGWTVPSKKAKGDTIVLNLNELDQLASMKLPKHLSKIKDICLIGAGTGQRHSDFSVYTPDCFYTTIKGIPLLSLISNKTDTPTKVPLNIFPWLMPILEKHGYSTPKMSMQKFNDGIKELSKLAGFNERILIVEQYIGRKARVEKYYAEKHEVIASHVCRRSFATNLFRMGYRLSQIMPMTGHATESQLRKYIGIDNEQNAEEIGLMILQQSSNSPFKNLRVASD